MPDILLVKVRFLHIGELIEQILLFINCHLQVLAHCKPMQCQILHYCVRPNLKQKYTHGNLLHCNCVCWLLMVTVAVEGQLPFSFAEDPCFLTSYRHTPPSSSATANM